MWPDVRVDGWGGLARPSVCGEMEKLGRWFAQPERCGCLPQRGAVRLVPKVVCVWVCGRGLERGGFNPGRV